MRCASASFLVVAPLCGASFSATRSRLKKSLSAAEQQRADVARARRRWMREQGMFDAARLVFIDETSANTKMMRLHGRCVRGERLVDHVPQGHWKTITFVAALRRHGMRASQTIDGSMTGKKFLAYVERCLAPTLKRKDIVMIDNLPAHKAAGVREAIEARPSNGLELRFKRKRRVAGLRSYLGSPFFLLIYFSLRSTKAGMFPSPLYYRSASAFLARSSQ